ncbi:G-protein coupled receptors family 1 profile domain-containing protein [Pleurotus pulmonarius]
MFSARRHSIVPSVQRLGAFRKILCCIGKGEVVTSRLRTATCHQTKDTRLLASPLPQGLPPLARSEMVPYLMTLREASEAAGSPEHALVNAYNAVQITGLVLLVAIVLTARLSSTINRSIAWYNLILSFIFYAVSFLLIMGKQFGPEPPFALCLVQCLFVYAAPVMNACACLCFALELLFCVSRTANQTQLSIKWRLSIILIPYIVPLLVCVEVLTFALTRHAIVRRKSIGMYCHLTIPTASLITNIVVTVFMALLLPVFGVTIYRVSRKWKASRHLRFDTDDRAPVQMIVRFGMVCLLPVPAVILSVLSVPAFDGRGDGPLAVAIATYPIWAALIFGIQSDILRVWAFRTRVIESTATLPSTSVSYEVVSKPSGSTSSV